MSVRAWIRGLSLVALCCAVATVQADDPVGLLDLSILDDAIAGRSVAAEPEPASEPVPAVSLDWSLFDSGVVANAAPEPLDWSVFGLIGEGHVPPADATEPINREATEPAVLKPDPVKPVKPAVLPVDDLNQCRSGTCPTAPATPAVAPQQPAAVNRGEWKLVDVGRGRRQKLQWQWVAR